MGADTDMSVRIPDDAEMRGFYRNQMIMDFCSRIQGLARRMHLSGPEQMYGWSMTLIFSAMLSLTAGAGCVVPPPLEKEVDGGVNRPPAIIWGSVKPNIGNVTDTDSATTLRYFNIGFTDLDKDVIHARLFVDGKYHDYIPISAEKTQGGRTKDSILFTVTGLCALHIKETVCDHMVEVYISDGGFIPKSTPSTDYRQVIPGGLRDSVAWRWKCEKSGSQ